MPAIPPSTKEQIVRTAERLFAEHGLDGVSLRQISAAAGSGNNSAVQYHFGSKDQLVEAIFEFRLPNLYARRQTLMAARRPADLRSWLECYVLPILEQGEQEASHYLSFTAMLQQHSRRDLFDRIPAEFLEPTELFHQRVGALLPGIPEPLRTHRVSQALAFSIHAAADRERARAHGFHVLPFAVHVTDVLDGLVGFLEAPMSPAAAAALEDTSAESSTRATGPVAWPVVL